MTRGISRTLAISAFCLAGLAPLMAQAADTTMLSYIQADMLQTAGLNGKGIKIGVISGGVQGISSLQASGSLPSNIGIVNNDLGTGGEGEAMLQVVHQIAPGASLYFCSAPASSPMTPQSVAPTATCASSLISDYGVDIIVDDLLEAVTMAPTQETEQYDALLQANPNVLAIGASGNYGSATYQAAYQAVSLTLPAGPTTSAGTYQVQDFGAAVGKASDPYNTVSLGAGQSLSLCFSTSQTPAPTAEDATPASDDEITAWLLDSSGKILTSATTTNTAICGFPSWTNSSSSSETIKIVLGVTAQNNTNPFYVMVSAQVGGCLCGAGLNLKYATDGGAGTMKAMVPEFIAVGASGEGSGTMEPYSSTGPYLQDYTAAQTGTNVDGYPIYSYTQLSSPNYLDTPHLTGADGVAIDPDSTYFNTSSFTGTSAAAPTVAGIAALLMQAGLTRDQIVTALEQSAKPLISSQSGATWNGKDGYGLIQGYDALIQGGVGVPQPTITSPTTTTVTAGNNLTFSGSCTVSGGGSITGYSWDFGNGKTSTLQKPGAITYSSAGTYTVTFNCTDNAGVSSGTPATLSVTVQQASSSGGGSGGSTGSSGGGGGSLSFFGLALLALAATKLLKGRHA